MAKRDGKWIERLHGEESAVKAARRTLRGRLRSVWKRLKFAVRSEKMAVDDVHQLRVATRRAAAAVQGYAELLPQRHVARIQKQLRRMRRRAGEARECDVMIERLSRHADAVRWKPLVERLTAQRREAERPIVRIYDKLRRRNFSDRVKKLLGKLHAPQHGTAMTFHAWARISLGRNIEGFFTAAAGNLSDLVALHEMRIEGKLLRYAVEHFACAFGPELRNELYPELERLQMLLGPVNDHASAIVLLEARRKTWADAELDALMNALLTEEHAALETVRRDFFRWWTPQRAAELERRFSAVIRPAEGETVPA